MANSRTGLVLTAGWALASYLLFESSYTSELMELGEADTLARRGDVARFFGWPALSSPRASLPRQWPGA